MKWVTRERPKIDRVACPWLIARFDWRTALAVVAIYALVLAWNDYLYQLKYPADYYLIPTGGGTAALTNEARSFWKNNRALTLGASLLLFR